MTNGANSGHWLGNQAQCLALASFLAILGTIPGLGAEASRPGVADRCSGAGCAEPPARGVTVYRGLVLDYEVIDGMAVHGGDIVLGTAAEAAAAAPSRQPAEPERSEGPARRDAYAVQRLWPGGRVPYEIDERIEGEDLEVTHAALEEWNSKTVIEFFPRTDEQQYALLVPVPAGVNCSSGLGPASPTTVNTGGCSLGSTIHELGHAVGLLQEQERPDRDEFLAVAPLYYSVGMLGSWWVPQWTYVGAPDPRLGPYDYGSNMHYGQYPRNVTTLPPGITFTGSPPGLSAGDIDGVARLYGQPPRTITIETNPTGHDVIVDGERVTAPAVFDWLPDSVHTLEAPLVQPGTRGRDMLYAFGRWSDGGGRRRTVRAGPDATWFQANLIPLEVTRPGVHPAGAGTVALSPESPDGRYARGIQVELTPVKAAGTPYEFARWSNWQTLLPQGPVLRHEVHGYQNDTRFVRAHFREPPLYRIGASVEGLRLPLVVNGESWLTPAAFQPSELPAGSRVSVPEFVPVRESLGSGGRYRFSGWSDGGEREHEIDAPAEGGALTVQVQREFQLDARADPSGGIAVSPESEDGFYAAGTQVQLTAMPPEGQYFLGWEHDASGTATTRFVIMDRDRRVSAKFARVEPIRVQSGEPLQADSLDGRHFVRVPDGTSEVAVRFESPATVREAGFRVTDNSSRRRELGRIRLRESDTITLDREALTRMRNRARVRPDRESHHLRIRELGGTGWSGQLRVSIQRDWIGGVWPPAFTFVSSAGWSRPLRQTLRVAPVEGEIPPVRYRIVSDSHWLEAFPPEWTGGQAEIAVTANGAALGAEAYGGKLRIQIDRGGDPAEGWTPTGIEIPVHFVVTPADGAGEPTGGGSTGLVGGDDHGDARSAATELAAGASVSGRLERVGDADWFRFRTTAAHTLITAYTVSDGDTVGELHVAGRDSPLADDDSGNGAKFRIVTSVPAGTHYLQVGGFGTPDYALTLEAVADDHGDTRDVATEVAVGASARGGLQVVGDADWFRFRTTAATTWVTAYTVSDGDTAGELHVAGHDSPLADDDSGSGKNFRITASVPAGTHYLRVSGSGTADYTLTLQEMLDAMEFVRIPAGSFVMGSPEDEEGHHNTHERQYEVTISQDFWMGKYEVTQGEWKAVMGSNPSRGRCAQCPVENVSWDDAQEFIRKLNERESGSGHAYRLPTEAEWEYAARAGTTGARHGELDEIAWYRDNSGGTTHPVGQKRANAWGLHDMLGNTWEWTADWFDRYPSGAVTDPTGPSTGRVRVYRGGGWDTRARGVRSAERGSVNPGSRRRVNIFIGIRLVRTN